MPTPTLYLLEPGTDASPVETYLSSEQADRSRRVWLDRRKLPRLFAFSRDRGMWREWIVKQWYDVPETNVPERVLARARAHRT